MNPDENAFWQLGMQFGVHASHASSFNTAHAESQ